MIYSAEKIINKLDRYLEEKLKAGEAGIPIVYVFHDYLKDTFDQTVEGMKKDGVNVIDLNEYFTICPEDYDISVTEAGYDDDIRVGDFSDDEKEKKKIIYTVKKNNLPYIINENTVLKIIYNEMFLEDGVLFDAVCGLLEDGYGFWCQERCPIPLRALVFLETEKKITDFCVGGVYLGIRLRNKTVEEVEALEQFSQENKEIEAFLKDLTFHKADEPYKLAKKISGCLASLNKDEMELLAKDEILGKEDDVVFTVFRDGSYEVTVTRAKR